MYKKISIILLAVGLSSSTAIAGDINSVINGLKGTPDKVSLFLNNEIEKTKEFQKKGWQDGKTQLVNNWNKILGFFQSKNQ
jgi:hypothetical protein|tara:strand:- start:650 stop:892 length:243 start_codon:yes stop_codon:yes gene_type:complete